jgi:hypothetical protein
MKPALPMIAALALLSSCGENAQRENLSQAAVENPQSDRPAAVAGTMAPARSSQYSPVSDAACEVLESSDETGDWTGSCPGVAGYRVEWSSSDLRDDLTLIEGDTRTPLQIPTLVAKGAFNSPGPRIEWRGPTGGAPDVLIVRVHVANPEGVSDSGRLAIFRLKPAACLVAIVPPQNGQSERARSIADGPLPDCLPAAD